jgi:farnesyl diphosphate synthase
MTKIESYLQRIEVALHTLLDQADIPAKRIKDAMHYTLFPGGKRLRPILVYLCGDVLNVNLDCLDVIAASIELTHCYSLVHDDLPSMDNDDFRRDRPSCHRAYDEATAILVGDGLQALAIDLLLTHLPNYLNSEQVIKVTHELLKASGPAGMVSGQCMDLTELSNPDIQETQLRRIHALKTGKLLEACVTMVLAVSTQTEAVRQALIDYARHLGLVFQMQDDYLDKYAPVTALGKRRASDSANNKLTFASLYSQTQLQDFIAQHFNRAREALAGLNLNAQELVDLSYSLQKRADKVGEKS